MPKGRLILPQVQVIRNVLDHQGSVSVVKELQYAALLASLNRAPGLVVCDSQVVGRMVLETPEPVLCTTFSILFSRNKGELAQQAHGIADISQLKDGDCILIAEACSHHPLEEDIGRVKIPRWLREHTRRDRHIVSCAGRNYPTHLSKYALVIHCGGCI